jgi:hypothetical protein
VAFPQTRTAAGNIVVVYATSAGGTYPVHGAYLSRDGESNIWVAAAWTQEGFKIAGNKPCDLDIPKEFLEELYKKNATTQTDQSPTDSKEEV